MDTTAAPTSVPPAVPTPRPWTDITGPVPDLRLVILDMDGTLLNGSDAVPDSFWELLPELRRRGITVVPASGRQYATLKGMFAEHGIRTFICENGTLVVHDDEVVSTSPVDSTTVDRIIDIVRTAETDRNVGLVVCGPRKAYIERDDDVSATEAHRYYRALEVVPNLHAVPDIEEGTVLKCACFDFDSAAQAASALFTGGGPGVADLREEHQVVVSGKNWIDIMNGSANKGKALRALEMNLGIPRSGVAVFGDYLNDLEMMAEGDWSFAMDNGHGAVQRAAQFVAPRNTDEGVVQVLRRLLGV
ncbi:HAD family hydrolase [Corynebacterium variabile]|uniref:HAD family hydrolase n=1 Tax=Corynebacterium variabile TaxID=1727 RepID=UPI0028B0AB7B|nr:HAD family hydrolase [Corynebacterium variabile]